MSVWSRILKRKPAQFIDWADIRRKASAQHAARRQEAFFRVVEGFTREGERDGYIYFKEDGKLLEIYWEISGASESDILIWQNGANQWVLPHREAIPMEKSREILTVLGAWLDQKKIRSDLDLPIHRSHG